MATSLLGRAILTKPNFVSLLSRSFASSSLVRVPPVHHRLRFLVAVKEYYQHSAAVGLRSFSSRPTTSSLNDPSPNWSNRPPKETILLDGCDFEHWLVVMEPPEENTTRDDIIDYYIKTLTQIVGSEDEARKKIYSVSTRCYYAFGCLVSEELSYKIKELPKVRWVLPDSYLDVKNKDYGGEPFIDGKAVPYDPKYHEEWIRNNARANERSRRNDRPRNNDRSRNFERRRENMQTRDVRPFTAPGSGSTGPAPHQSQGSVPTGGMPSPGYQNQGAVPNSGSPSQVQGGMPSGGYQNPNRGAIPNSGFQHQGYQSPGVGRVQNNPTFPNQGPRDSGYQGGGGAPVNPRYQNQGVGGVPSTNPGYQNQGMGDVPPASHGNPNSGIGGVPPASHGNPNSGIGGVPPASYQNPNSGMGGVPPASYGNPNSGMGGVPPASYGNPNSGMGGVPPASYGNPNSGMGGVPPASHGNPNLGMGGGYQNQGRGYQNEGAYQNQRADYQNQGTYSNQGPVNHQSPDMGGSQG